MPLFILLISSTMLLEFGLVFGIQQCKEHRQRDVQLQQQEGEGEDYRRPQDKMNGPFTELPLRMPYHHYYYHYQGTETFSPTLPRISELYTDVPVCGTENSA